MSNPNESDEDKRLKREQAGINPSDYSEALERGLLILQAFSSPQIQLTQADIARAVDLPRATVRRTLVTLTYLGYLEAEGRNYRLTPKVLSIASAYLTTNPVTQILQPVCERIANEVGASCTVSVLDQSDAVMIARALPAHSVTLGVGLGYRVPAPYSALGRVLLGAVPEGQRQQIIASKLAENDPTSVESETSRIEEAIRTAQENGFAYVANEVDHGFHSVAVPLLRWDGQQIAALNVGATLEKISAAKMTDEIRIKLQETARKLQNQLI